MAVVANTEPGSIAVLLNDGTSNFALFNRYQTGGQYSGGADAADVDGDGQTDLVVANWGAAR